VIRSIGDLTPAVDPSAFVAETAALIGGVVLGPRASVWFGTVVRGDVNAIVIGAETNLQDLTMVHVTGGRFSTHIGERVTVGHRALLHGCTVADECLIGMGSILLDGVVVGAGSIIGAGAVVSPGTHVPAGVLVVGVPGRIVREVSTTERAELKAAAQRYVELARRYAGRPG
jgi:carbonic anhydrase/acetyltransferase-like protein (isoleucine patch superfamily)